MNLVEKEKNPILGIDVSHWQDKIDWELLKSEGVQFAIVKATQGSYYVDPRFETHFNGAKNAGMVTGVYHWNDPMSLDHPQSNLFLDTIKDFPFDFKMVDVEQYWQDWAEYRAKKVTKIISPIRISESGKKVSELTETDLVYTRISFITERSPQMTGWIKEFPLCLAQYIHPKSRTKTTWKELKEKYIPNISLFRRLPGTQTWHFWQFSGDKFLLPGVWDSTGKISPLDLILFNGSIEDLEKFSSGNQVIHPDPSEGKTTLVVAVDYLNVRAGPGVEYQVLGTIKGGTKVSVLDVGGKNAWVEIEPGNWVCASMGSVKFLIRE